MPPSAPVDAAAEARARWTWVGIILALIGSQLAIAFVAVWYAVGDPALAVVPDYYDKAVRWDELRAIRQRSADLGWQVQIGWTPPDPAGNRQLTVQVLDAHGGPAPARDATLQCYHHAHGTNVETIALTERDPGVFTGTAQLAHPGLYRWNFEASFGDKPFVWEEDRAVDAPELDRPTG